MQAEGWTLGDTSSGIEPTLKVILLDSSRPKAGLNNKTREERRTAEHMTHSDLRTGTEFWCGGRRWRCTDVGTRVVVALCLEPHEVVTFTENAEANGTRTTRTVTDESWFAGPPYAVVEEVFDE